MSDHNTKETNKQKTSIQNESNEIEFSLLEVLQTIYSSRMKIIRFAIFGLFVGLFYAFLFNPNEYKARAVILPINSATESAPSSLLKKFGKLGGISIGGSSASEGIPPGLYPNVVNSTPFLIYLSNQKVTIEEEDSTMTLFHYYHEIHSSGLGGFIRSWTIEIPDKIMGLFRDQESKTNNGIKGDNQQQPLRLTKKEQNVINTLNDRISVQLDEEAGILELFVTMPEANLTAEVAVLTLDYLEDYSIAFKTEKERDNLNFIKGRYEEAKKRFYEAQENLALFNDRNQNLTTAKAKSEKERLEAEYNLTFDLYNGLSQQLEESRIKVQESAPAFKVLEPVQVPVNKSSPRKLLVIFAFTFIGFIIGLLWSLYGEYIISFMNQVSYKKNENS